MTLKQKIVENAVKNMKEFGYPSVDTKNIFTDVVYKQFFLSMLKDNLSQGYDEVINNLIKEIK